MDARVTRTRSLLRDAMLALLQDGDAHSITAQRIVAQAGVGYATFFRHYPGVDTLLLDVADELMGRLVKQVAPAL
ncbi:TetR/AcrR family transcriptional regulator, partial [Pseudomonas sp. EL_65y_Pfl2_R96]